MLDFHKLNHVRAAGGERCRTVIVTKPAHISSLLIMSQ